MFDPFRVREFDLEFAVAPRFEPPQDALLTHSQQKRNPSEKLYFLTRCPVTSEAPPGRKGFAQIWAARRRQPSSS